MAEALKSIYHEKFLRGFGEQVKSVYNPFDIEGFTNKIMDDSWEELALKARTRRISETLGEFLPASYEEALAVLFQIDEKCVGFPYLFFPDFVEVYGQAEEDWNLSMTALERFTQRSSAEFAVRSFIIRDTDRMMQQMLDWSKHSNEHVRRLASEGCRPRLPWGQALTMFKRDPGLVLPILEQLKEDPSLYVRKSVANNLNDITKDHPAIVIGIAKRWIGSNPDTNWIVRHACRNLIRKADPEIMGIFGYSSSDESEPLVVSASLSIGPEVLSIGESSEIHYQLHIREGEPARIRIEYGIYFIKANGQAARKLFLLSDKSVPGGTSLSGKRKHGWADLTTRRHYPGEHRIALLVNGQEVAETTLILEACSL
ncbi:hypothetical protein GRF59_04575 [Paenibacillus sp. HJL G12]|uniref:DNA alkylation repair protein n=1 Tax=Paenibacillus dendrobii TaxID=2691084 RepID=A0A7X3IFH7_9BACL|nr:hypothetical protein [Paenibacillus dendrobii]